MLSRCPPALAPGGADGTADAARRTAARIADRCTPDQGCSDPRWCDRPAGHADGL